MICRVSRESLLMFKIAKRTDIKTIGAPKLVIELKGDTVTLNRLESLGVTKDNTMTLALRKYRDDVNFSMAFLEENVQPHLNRELYWERMHDESSPSEYVERLKHICNVPIRDDLQAVRIVLAVTLLCEIKLTGLELDYLLTKLTNSTQFLLAG